MRTKRILSPLSAIVFALALFQAACATEPNPPAAELVITTPVLPGGITGASYSQNLAATGGTPPYAWSLGSGQSLPAGLSLSQGGTISGTPSAAGNFNVGVHVSDAGSATASHSFAIAIVAGLQSTTGNPAVDGHQFSSYAYPLTATGGTPPYAWTLDSGTLPAGVTLNAAGTLGGTPTVAGQSTVTLRVTDAASLSATQSLVITVMPSFVTIATATLAEGENGTPYSSQTLTAVGGAPPYVWTISSGSLPAGVTFSTAGALGGMPSVAGTAHFTVKAQDNASNINYRTYDLVVHPLLQITTTSLPTGHKNQALSFTLNATNGVAPYNWSLQSGTLPAGVSVFGTGSIAGIPTALGTFNFRVRVADALGAVTFQNLSLVIAPPPVSITTIGLPDGEVGAAYNTTMAANGTPPYAWGINAGALPAGVSMSASGVISGSPTAEGPVSVVIQVTDAAASTFVKSYFFTVKAGPAISTTSLPDGQVNNSYSQQLAAAGGVGAYTWSLKSGVLPAGTSLHLDGMISGTPTILGLSSFTVQVRDAAGALAQQPLSINITSVPITINSTLPDCEAEQNYSQQLSASGGSQPYTWTLQSGTLFPGWTLSSGGLITGVCGGSGSSTFTVRVTNVLGTSTLKTFTITWHSDLSIATTSLPDPTLGVAYNQTLVGQGGVTPYSWATFSACLPQGLSLNTATGVVSGTPTLLGPTICQINLTDAIGVTVHKTYTLTVNP